MKVARQVDIIRRRDVLISAASAGLILALGRKAQAAEPNAGDGPQLETVSPYEQALDKILGESKPHPGKITFDIPDIAENGNTVPYKVSVESPMTEADHIQAIYVLASENPIPNIISCYLTPAAGLATVSSRMRLAKTQNVVVLAKKSDGRFWLAEHVVKVTIGGCGG
ncbi:MAG: thiosulfate oxidation carrier protein SoxY [Hyphomicrobiaceae bacterium]